VTLPRARWTASGSETLGSLLERAGESAALAEGRVFVDRRRASDAASFPAHGSIVEVYARRDVAEAPRILRVERGLAFVDKPVGLATEPERRGSTESVVHRIATELGVVPQSVNALSRLDVGVSGVVVLGLDTQARQRVQQYREHGLWRRRYVALAAAQPELEAGSWNAPIAKRGSLRVVHPSGEHAVTNYRVTGRSSGGAAACVLALDPMTGRTHQLRVHAAAHGAPLFGDRSYGGPRRVVAQNGAVLALSRIFLHATWVDLPDQGRIVAPLPAEFESLWSAFHGESGALTAAVELEPIAPP